MTDLEPALDVARGGAAKVETAGWDTAKRLRPRHAGIWHTFMTSTDYVSVRDRRRYWGDS